MVRFFSVLLLVLGLAAPLAAPTPVFAQEGAIEVTPERDQDAAIAVRIREILGELGGYQDVTVSVNAGIVTLRGHTLDAASLDRLIGLVARIEGVVAIENKVTETTDLGERLTPAWDRMQNRIVQTIAFLPLIGVGFIAFLLVSGLGFAIARMRQPWDRLAPNEFIADIYRTVIRIAGLIAGVVVALDLLGATALLSTFLGAAGIVGLAFGFAIRDTVENFIASIMLSIRQPFRPNDTVEIEGDQGKVIRLTARATILLSFDGNHIRIPNSTVFKARIVNFSRNAERRFLFDIGILPTADMAAARHITEDTLTALPFTLPAPAVSVWIEDVAPACVTLRCTGWIDQNATSITHAKSEAIRMTRAALEAGGVALPDPISRIVMETNQPTAKSAQAPAEPAKIPAAEAVDTRDEQALDQMIADERKDQDVDDLLSRAAPEE